MIARCVHPIDMAPMRWCTPRRLNTNVHFTAPSFAILRAIQKSAKIEADKALDH